jgi:hypothetical protein
VVDIDLIYGYDLFNSIFERTGKNFGVMSYYVRLLTPSLKVVPFTDLMLDVESVKLASGMADAWERIEIRNPEGSIISILERIVVTPGTRAEAVLAELKASAEHAYPASARAWVKSYLSRVKTVYSFELLTDNINQNSWPFLGRVQNLLKDALSGIIQADNEGFFNENGDYILWQMFEGATGTVPAAVLNENGEWTRFELRLKDERAVEQFKQGIVPARGFLDRLFGR